jgi:RNA polymerase sigma-70 factor, ECF subfamily
MREAPSLFADAPPHTARDALLGSMENFSVSEPSQSATLSAVTPPEDDITLMQKAGAGDLEAFETLVRRHQHAVIGTAAKMLGSHADAQDIAQQVFLRAWKSAPNYRPTAKFTTWLMTITRNLVFNESRRKLRARLFSINEPSHPNSDSPRDFHDPSQRPPDAIAAEEELQHAIDAALETLPKKARMAIILRRYENMPYEEIASVLKISVPAVKSLIFRARGELKSRLAKFL